ncbi:hypothetical protein M501DRAFT_442552 [Patellaria atrata CBS 101060]|uniref:Uncharacterized protein n=1 Tax=Patellaria atrata CBS 101060 TaxID=1346257 RepID=A0A9P4VN56_9PEZI|nr:hypothetical protein M501DRAFT_442552 [Patellaria atrata CBS 101060]
MGNTNRAVDLFEHVVKLRKTTLPETDQRLLLSQYALPIAYQSSRDIEMGTELLEYVIRPNVIKEYQNLIMDHAWQVLYCHSDKLYLYYGGY